MAQVADYMISLKTGDFGSSDIAIWITFFKFYSPPAFNIMSLYPAESHAMLPNAHTACSTIPACSDSSRSTNIFTPPFSMIELVC